MWIQRTDEADASRFTVTDGTADHSFEVYDEGNQVVVEFEEAQHARGRVSTDAPAEEVWDALTSSEEFRSLVGDSPVSRKY